jgi:uncharacterized membrane protein
MSQLIVIKFDDMEQAGKVREALRAQEKSGLIKMEDAEVIVCDAEGKIKTHSETDRGIKIGAVGGGMLGLLLGLVFFPVGGLILGAAAGALIGKSLGLGVDKKFVKDVEAALTPGTSALFIMVVEANSRALFGAIEPFQGTLLQTTLSSEDEETLRRALQ